jgi:uncharacterized membrane protein affecting hemolysin expression
MKIPMLQRLSRGLLQRRWTTAALALLLIASSLLLAWQRERAAALDEAQSISAQAGMLASSLTGALAFDDTETTREQLETLTLDPDIQAAGVYAIDGQLVAGFARQGVRLPATVVLHPPQTLGRELSVVKPVAQGSLALGKVYLRTSVEPFAERLSRYLAIGLIILMAALLIGVFAYARTLGTEDVLQAAAA